MARNSGCFLKTVIFHSYVSHYQRDPEGKIHGDHHLAIRTWPSPRSPALPRHSPPGASHRPRAFQPSTPWSHVANARYGWSPHTPHPRWDPLQAPDVSAGSWGITGFHGTSWNTYRKTWVLASTNLGVSIDVVFIIHFWT